MPIAFSSYAGTDISRDNGPVVDRDYEPNAPYVLTRTVKNVIFDLKPAVHDDEHALRQHTSLNAMAHGSRRASHSRVAERVARTATFTAGRRFLTERR